VKRIKIVEEVFLKYERRKNISSVSLYKDNLDHPPSIMSTVSLKELIFNSLNSKSFKSINQEYIEQILKDLQDIQEDLKQYSEDYPEFGFGDNT